MKLNSKARYAVMALADLAKNNAKEPTSLTEISLRQGISIDYLEQLFLKLRKNNLVQSARGPLGGYVLSKPPGEIKLLSIISAVDEKIKTVKCRKEKKKDVMVNQSNVLLTTCGMILKLISTNFLKKIPLTIFFLKKLGIIQKN